MLTINISDKPLVQQQAAAYALLLPDTFTFEHDLKPLAEQFYAPLATVVQQRNFKGAAGAVLTVAGIDNQRPVYLILVGLGSKNRTAHDRLEQFRRSMATVMRTAEGLKVTELAVAMPDPSFADTDLYQLAKELVIAAEMATYHFDQFITDDNRKKTKDSTITFSAPALWHDKMTVGIEQGRRVGYAVNQARHWCDLPANHLTPTILAQHATNVAQAHGLTATVFDKDKIQELGMGGLIAVSQGSAQPPRFVILEYRTDAPQAPTIALVCKGVTFDSGGISIKPAGRMDEMKADMAGAAAVISSLEMIAHLKPRVNVIGIAPLTENMPSGTATKPGDIIQFYNGKTAEIKNTDAEGRLILADALSYAVKHYNPDAIIDFATLTGACSYALGPFFCGLMSKHDDLAEKVVQAGRKSGDRAWPLPFHDDYKVAVTSKVADICNIGNESYRAGAITAGFFLHHFVGSTPWVHLDIAGTSFNVPDVSYYRPGATGFGVRMIAELLLNWQ